jgi:hypothetical protein
MKNRSLSPVSIILGLVLGAVVCIGCGAETKSAGAANRAACEDYNDQLESLDCDASGATQDCEVYDQTSCDISDYFDCLAEKTECTEVAGQKTIDQTKALECAAMAECS